MFIKILCAGQIVLPISPPSPPRGSLGVRGKMGVITKGVALENDWTKVIN